jgi:phospholipid-binding lipoprotein MlaA
VATHLGFEKQKEDFGQTLAVYGVGSGPYLVLPLLGPSTLRDAIGRVTGFVADPVTVALNREGKEDWIWIGTALKGIDFREQNLEKIDNLEATSVDFYATIRSLYLERRNRMIRNQAVNNQDPFQEFDVE